MLRQLCIKNSTKSGRSSEASINLRRSTQLTNQQNPVDKNNTKMLLH